MMAAECEKNGFVYVKEGFCGTVYITADSGDPVVLTFVDKIRVEVFLNSGRPGDAWRGEVQEIKEDKKHSSLDTDGEENCDIGNENVTDDIEKQHPARSALDNVGQANLHTEQDEDDDDTEMAGEGDEDQEVSSNESNEDISEKDTHSTSVKYLDEENRPKGQSLRPRRTAIKRQKKQISQKKDHSPDEDENKNQTSRSLRHRKKTAVHSKTGRKDQKAEKSAVKTDNLPSLPARKSQRKVNKPKAKLEAKWKKAGQVTCQYCLKVFENQQAFYDHKKTPRSSSYECSICQKTFPFKAHLQVHTKAQHSDQDIVSNLKETESCKCEICGAVVKNMFALKKHLMVHTQEYFYCCCICGRQFVEPGTLNNHMSTHKSGGMIRCTCCNQLFATRGALAKHKLASMEVKCHLCGELFPNRTSRTQHYKIFHQNDILKCAKCNSMFSSEEELAIHMKKHTLYKKKQCTTCGKFFSRLERHVVTHKAKADIEESDLFVCDKCPRKFTNRSSFQRHLTIHSQDKPYQCPNCPRKFADCGVLRKHLRRHSSLMPYECEVCGKRCKEPGNLKVHMRIHSDTKHFQCSLCPQAFNYKTSLEGHMRSRHSQNLAGANAISDAGELKPDYDNKVSLEGQPTYVAAGTRLDIMAPQGRASGEERTDASHLFDSRVAAPQFYMNRPATSSKSHCDEMAIVQDTTNMMGRRQMFEGHPTHPIHRNTLTLNMAPKHLYDTGTVGGAAVNLSAAYSQERHPATPSQPHEESLNVTSLDMTTVNVSSMNVSLYG